MFLPTDERTLPDLLSNVKEKPHWKSLIGSQTLALLRPSPATSQGSEFAKLLKNCTLTSRYISERQAKAIVSSVVTPLRMNDEPRQKCGAVVFPAAAVPLERRRRKHR
jgi:hypothetical protein